MQISWGQGSPGEKRGARATGSGGEERAEPRGEGMGYVHIRDVGPDARPGVGGWVPAPPGAGGKEDYQKTPFNLSRFNVKGSSRSEGEKNH